MVSFKCLCIALTAIVSIGLGGCYSKYEAEKAMALFDISILNDGLKMYVEEVGGLPDIRGRESWDEANIAVIDALINGKKGGRAYIEVSPSRLNLNGAFVDPWGMPYLILLEGSFALRERKIHFKKGQKWMIWSCGRNMINDWGEGDDILTGGG